MMMLTHGLVNWLSARVFVVLAVALMAGVVLGLVVGCGGGDPGCAGAPLLGPDHRASDAVAECGK